jgi:thiamine-phosphate pyrophosphorylase
MDTTRSSTNRERASSDPPSKLHPILCLVVDRSCGEHATIDAVEAAVAGGVDWVQIRDRSLPSASLLEFSRNIDSAIRRAANGRPIRLIVNRRIDIALALTAHGVHLGFDALGPAHARALLPAGTAIGCSTHSPAEVKAAADAQLDYVHLAPIYSPLSKTTTRPSLGTVAVHHATTHGIAVLAQGGVEAAHCAELVRAGARGIAVTGAILLSDEPQDAARSLRRALDA